MKSTYENPIPIEKKIKLKDKINPVLSNKCRRRLKYMHHSSFDWKYGGISSPIKFIDRDSVEYSLETGSNGDINEKRMLESTPMTAILYINTNDGYTVFEDGTKIDSVANRICIFPYYLKHSGTTCTNANRRIALNINYVR